jgi:hypothetical protein
MYFTPEGTLLATLHPAHVLQLSYFFLNYIPRGPRLAHTLSRSTGTTSRSSVLSVVSSCNIPTFIIALCHFFQELSKENELHLVQSGILNAFMCEPVLIPFKSMWDLLQEMNPKTLDCSFFLTGNVHTVTWIGSSLSASARSSDFGAMQDDSECIVGSQIEAWQQNNKANGVGQGYSDIQDVKSLLMPRQHLLKTLDPLCTHCTKSVEG